MARLGGMLRSCAAALLLLGGRVQAEVFHFDSELVPDGRTLVAKYMFYVYSHKDAPDRSKGHPYVQFADFDLEYVGDPDDTDNKFPQLAQSLQVSLIPWEDFWNLVDPSKFCSTVEDVQSKAADAPNRLLLQDLPPSNYTKRSVHVHDVKDTDPAAGVVAPAPGTKAGVDRQALKRTGVYLLVITNCGEASEVTISGKVIVRNSYGFLPGNEYGKMMLYIWIAIAYFGISAFWVAMSLRYWQELIYIHYCISMVTLLGLGEAVLWWGHLAQWNATGNSFQILLSSAILFSGAKSVATFILVLVTALGKGVQQPNLDGSTLMKIWALGILYVVLDFTRMYVMELRHRYSLSVKFVGMCIVPTVTLSAVIVVWAFMAISGLIKELREQGQVIKLQTYQRFNCLMVFALLAALGALAMQMYDQPGRPADWWRYHWMATDAVSSSVFMLFLLAMMCIWQPYEGSKMQATSQQIVAMDDMEDVDVPTGFGNDSDGEKPAGGFLDIDGAMGTAVVGTVEMAEKAEERNSPRADTIGATDRDQV